MGFTKKVCNGSQKKKFSNIKRYFAYFSTALKLFNSRRKYERIIAWQQFFGIILCWLLKIFHSKSNVKITILTFIYKEKKGFFGKLYKRFVKKALTSKQLEYVIVLSSSEIDYYSNIFDIKKDLFRFIPIGIDKKPKYEIDDEGYFLSAGRSNRDYQFLINAFKEIPKSKLVIICDNLNCKQVPSNVIILNNCFGNEYEKYISKCHCMIISLCNEPVSSGQLVANNAMVYNKPIIATINSGITDYVIDKENGLIIEKNVNDLQNAIAYLSDSNNYNKIANSKIRFSEYDYGKKLNCLLRNVKE